MGYGEKKVLIIHCDSIRITCGCQIEMLLHSFPPVTNQYLAGSKMLRMPMLLVLTAPRSHISLGPALRIIQVKGLYPFQTKPSIGSGPKWWFIKSGIFFPFMVIPDMSEKGRQLLLEMSSLNLGRDLKPQIVYNLNLFRMQCGISKGSDHSSITGWGCGKFWKTLRF